MITLFAFTLMFSCKDKTKENTTDTRTIKIEEAAAAKNPTDTITILKQVAAISGLNYRKSPKGKVISKFKYKTEVTIIEKTGILEEITDNGEQITGEWVGVKHGKKTVYVFDAFLTDTEKKPVKKLLINPIDKALFEGYIIMPGEYHSQEIPDKITTENWYGIFKENENYAVEKTTINISRIEDPSTDNVGSKTGKKIVALNTKECYLLINNIPYLSERSFTPILTTSKIIHPEKPFSYNANGINYTLSATADSYKPLDKEELYINPKNYKLYIESIVNGSNVKQLLVFENFFEEQMIKILFIGDIDGDTIPDLLIDSANHYNASVPTLYLSKEAKEGEDILKIVSLHNSISF